MVNARRPVGYARTWTLNAQIIRKLCRRALAHYGRIRKILMLVKVWAEREAQRRHRICIIEEIRVGQQFLHVLANCANLRMAHAKKRNMPPGPMVSPITWSSPYRSGISRSSRYCPGPPTLIVLIAKISVRKHFPGVRSPPQPSPSFPAWRQS